MAVGNILRLDAHQQVVDDAFGIEASFRSIGAVSFNYENAILFPGGEKADAFLQSPLRVIVGGKPLEKWSYTAHAVQFITATTYDAPASGSAGLPSFLLYLRAKCPASKGTSSGRSRSEGSRMGNTFSR